MCPATTHVEKVVAVIITTLTLNIVQYVTVRLEQPLVVLATNNFLWVELHRLHSLDTGSYKGNLHAIVSILNTQSMQLVTVCNSLVPRQPGNEVKCMHIQICM